MSRPRRWSAVLLAVGVLIAAGAGACGGDDAAERTGGGTSAPSEPRTDADEGRRGLVLELSFDEPLRAGEPVVWHLRLANVGEDEVALTFPDGQSGDVLLERDGEVAYRWSDGQMFTQAVREETVGPGEAVEYELEEPSLDVEPGAYELTARISARSAPPPVTRDVTVAG